MRRNAKVGLEMNGRLKAKSVARKSVRKEIATTRGGGGVLGVWFAVVMAGLASLGGPPALAGPVEIIDDKSDFDGLNFTMIDFETRGDGSLYDFGSSNFVFLPAEEYLGNGVRISSPLPGFNNPFVSSIGSNPFVHEALRQVGSPDNVMGVGVSHGIIRLDFPIEVAAFGMSIIEVSDSDPLQIQAYNVFGGLIGDAIFDQERIDGYVLGEPFGFDFDYRFGFLGLSTNSSPISYVLINEDVHFVDDVHFAAVPEPSSLVLLISFSLVTLVFAQTERLSTSFIRLGGVAVVMLASTVPSRAEPISGTVTGKVIVDEKRICGPGGPSGCEPVSFVQVPLEDVCVREQGEPCVFTDKMGRYEIIPSESPITIEATLQGPTAYVGALEVDPNGFFFVPNPPVITITGVPVGGTANFVFNAAPDTTTHTGEVLAASVSTYYHMERIHRLLKDRQPDLVEIDSPLGAALDQVLPGEAGFLVTTLDGPIATFPPTSPLLVQPNYADRATMAGKSSVQRV